MSTTSSIGCFKMSRHLTKDTADESVVKCRFKVYNKVIESNLNDVMLRTNKMHVMQCKLYKLVVLDIVEMIDRYKSAALLGDDALRNFRQEEVSRYDAFSDLVSGDNWESNLLDTLSLQKTMKMCLAVVTTLTKINNYGHKTTYSTPPTVKIDTWSPPDPQKPNETELKYNIRRLPFKGAKQRQDESVDAFSARLTQTFDAYSDHREQSRKSQNYICFRVKSIYNDLNKRIHNGSFEAGYKVGDRTYIYEFVDSMTDTWMVNCGDFYAKNIIKRVERVVKHEIISNQTFREWVQQLQARRQKDVIYVLMKIYTARILGMEHPEFNTSNHEAAALMVRHLVESENNIPWQLTSMEESILSGFQHAIPQFKNSDFTVLKDGFWFNSIVAGNEKASIIEGGAGNPKFIAKYYHRYMPLARLLTLKEHAYRDYGFKLGGVLPKIKIKPKCIDLNRRNLISFVSWMYHIKDIKGDDFNNLFSISQPMDGTRPDISALIKKCIAANVTKSYMNTHIRDDKNNNALTNLFMNMISFPSKLKPGGVFSGVITTNCYSMSVHIRKVVPAEDRAAHKAKRLAGNKRKREEQELAKKMWSSSNTSNSSIGLEVPIVAIDAHDGVPGLPLDTTNVFGLDFRLDVSDSWSSHRDFVFVDPGEINILTFVRETVDDRKNRNKYFPKDQSGFITAKAYRSDTKMTWASQKNKHTRKNDKRVRRAFKDLSLHSSKTWDPGKFIDHMLIVWRDWDVLFNHVFIKGYREREFIVYQAKQRYITKILLPKLCPRSPKNTILVFGNWGNSPTKSQGNRCGPSSTPVKWMQRELSRFVPIVSASEAYTSKMSLCCVGETFHRGHYDKDAKKKKGKRIRGLSHCKCGQTFDRDIAAALNIRKLFWYQNTNSTYDNCLRSHTSFTC